MPRHRSRSRERERERRRHRKYSSDDSHDSYYSPSRRSKDKKKDKKSKKDKKTKRSRRSPSASSKSSTSSSEISSRSTPRPQIISDTKRSTTEALIVAQKNFNLNVLDDQLTCKTLDMLNDDTFQPRAFTSSSNKSSKVIIDLQKDTILVPTSDNAEPVNESLFHPNATSLQNLINGSRNCMHIEKSFTVNELESDKESFQASTRR